MRNHCYWLKLKKKNQTHYLAEETGDPMTFFSKYFLQHFHAFEFGNTLSCVTAEFDLSDPRNEVRSGFVFIWPLL